MTEKTKLSEEEMSALIETDPIKALCILVEEAGLTMTLYGVPVTEQELKKHALESATERMADAICRGIEKREHETKPPERPRTHSRRRSTRRRTKAVGRR